MSSETKLAFAHPLQRSESTGDPSLDRISVRDFVMDVEIGAFQVERDITQRIRFNIVVEVASVDAPLDDDVDRILSYDKVTEAVEFEMAAERLNLLETLADRIAHRILLEPQAERVFVRIEKLDRGPATLGVEIERSRAQAVSSTISDDMPQPIVILLPNSETDKSRLKDWIGVAEQHAQPVIFCVETPTTTVIQVPDLKAQRHIDLLALEQNAWRLAALDPRCVVVGTKTEMDWGMRNNQINVWAPSKLVLDAVNGPGVDASAAELALWIAGQIGATAVYYAGERPTGSDASLIAATIQDFA